MKKQKEKIKKDKIKKTVWLTVWKKCGEYRFNGPYKCEYDANLAGHGAIAIAPLTFEEIEE